MKIEQAHVWEIVRKMRQTATDLAIDVDGVAVIELDDVLALLNTIETYLNSKGA